MDENLHNDPLENLFRKNLEDQNLDNRDPAPNDWDLPSDQVWEGIGEALHPAATIPEKGILLSTRVQVLSLAAGVLILFGVFTCFRSYQQQLSSLSQQVEQLTEQQKATPEKTREESSGTATFPKNSPQNTPATNSTEQMPAAPSNEEQQAIPSTPTNATSNASSLDKTIITPVPAPADKTLKNAVRPTAPIANNSSLIPPASSAPKQLAPPNPQEQEEASQVVFTPMEEQTNVVPQTNEVAPAEQPLEPRTSMVTLTPLPMPSIASLSVPPTTIDYPISANPIINTFRSSGSKGFYAGLLYAPSVTFIKIKLPPGGPRNRYDLGKIRTKTTAFLGLKLGYHFNDRWALETEGRYGKTTVKTNHSVELKYSTLKERKVGPNRYQGDYTYSIPTAYGDVDTDISLFRESSTNLQEDESINLDIESEQQFQMVSIPLVVKYRMGAGPLRFSLRGGASANFISKEEFKIVKTNVPRSGLSHNQTKFDPRPKMTKKTSFDLLTGIGLDYQPSPHWRFSLEPSFAIGLKPVFKNTRVKTYPRSLSVSAGINYQF